MTRAEKEYLELKVKDIVRETVNEVVDKLPCEDKEKRIRKIERNNIKINLLYGFFVLLFVGLIKLAFF